MNCKGDATQAAIHCALRAGQAVLQAVELAQSGCMLLASNRIDKAEVNLRAMRNLIGVKGDPERAAKSLGTV